MGRVLLIALAGLTLAHASDFTGVYARIDKVVMEPNSEAPERVQVWGVFALASASDGQSYQKPARGYLYFKLDRDPKLARNEWNDLQQVAGTGQIVAFGARFGGAMRLRKKDESPQNPDPYVMNIGLRKISGRTDYEPIRALLDFKD
jgi:hypothetical protein